jgi:hypothetical protein
MKPKLFGKRSKSKTQALQAEMAARTRDRVRLAEKEEDTRNVENILPPKKDTV